MRNWMLLLLPAIKGPSIAAHALIAHLSAAASQVRDGPSVTAAKVSDIARWVHD